MNKEKRTRLKNANSMLYQALMLVESVRDDEQDCFSNLPESLQESENGRVMEDAIDALDDAISSINEASGFIDDACGG